MTLPEERRQAELAALAALVGGEFANLLAPVLGNVTLLEGELPEGDRLRQRVAILRDAVAAARGFAQRLALLDPKRKPSLEPIAIEAWLRDCLPALRAQLRPEVTLELLPSEVTECVLADGRQLELALTELVRNGQEAMAGAGALRLDLVVLAGGVDKLPAGRWLRLRVRDNGSGMEPAVAVRAFEPGVTTKVPAGGGGLGLSIVAAIVRLHRGFVEVETQPGQGTTLSLYLPSECGEAAAQVTPPPTREPAAAGAGAAAGASILLVEDNPMVRRSIEATLRLGGYRVSSVDSGERCLEAVGHLDVPLDLLISDVIMPEMGGEEMIDRVRELRPELPVLFISGYDRSSLARKQQSSVGDHFLQKPFDSEDLFAAVRRAMATRPGQGGT
jgi:two-component system cell cycle sensor histidine kinase/response regulator CckA